MSCQYITCRIDCCRGFVADCARSEAAQNLFLPLGVDVHVVLTPRNLGQILAAFPAAPARACSYHRWQSKRKKDRERVPRLRGEWGIHCKKKVSGFPVPSRDVTNQTLPGRDIRLGTGKPLTFLQCTHMKTRGFSDPRILWIRYEFISRIFFFKLVVLLRSFHIIPVSLLHSSFLSKEAASAKRR